MKKAFTFVEILIVMTILSILIALGVAGMLRFRRELEADQAVKDLVSIIKETETLAKNNSVAISVSPGDILNSVWGYRLRFTPEGDDVYRDLCRRDFQQDWITTYSSCTPSVADLKANIFNNIEVRASSGYCDQILFENLSGQLIIMKDGNRVDEVLYTKCPFEVWMKDDTIKYATIIFNTETDSYEVTKP